jgi:hypothetical protein
MILTHVLLVVVIMLLVLISTIVYMIHDKIVKVLYILDIELTSAEFTPEGLGRAIDDAFHNETADTVRRHSQL